MAEVEDRHGMYCPIVQAVTVGRLTFDVPMNWSCTCSTNLTYQWQSAPNSFLGNVASFLVDKKSRIFMNLTSLSSVQRLDMRHAKYRLILCPTEIVLAREEANVIITMCA